MSAKFVAGALPLAVVLLLLVAESMAANRCGRKPRQGIQHGPKKAGDGGYQIQIDGEPNGYQPGKIYNCECSWSLITSSILNVSFRFSVSAWHI